MKWNREGKKTVKEEQTQTQTDKIEREAETMSNLWYEKLTLKT